MFSSVKILKPDALPRRRELRFPSLRARLSLWLFPARYFIAVWDAIAKQGPAAERKVFWRHRA